MVCAQHARTGWRHCTVALLIYDCSYWHKPSHAHVWESLRKLAALCEEHDVRRLSIPVIACGLDRLRWVVVKEMLARAFERMDIAITVYVWGENKQQR